MTEHTHNHDHNHEHEQEFITLVDDQGNETLFNSASQYSEKMRNIWELSVRELGSI